MYKTKIFFTASFLGKAKYQKYYDLVVKTIKSNNVDLIATEVGNYKQLLTVKEIKKSRSKLEEHYLAIKKGIQWADLIILELSHESFQVGHEATLAMQGKKHVLGLSIERDWSEFILNDYFHGEKYNEFKVDNLVSGFIDKYKDTRLSERLNLFLSPLQEKKLESAARRKGLNKSELVRELIEGL